MPDETILAFIGGLPCRHTVLAFGAREDRQLAMTVLT